MENLSIDIETYSDVDLNSCGVYKYAESRAFEVLLFSYSVDGAEPVCVDIANGETLPADVLAALTDDAVTGCRSSLCHMSCGNNTSKTS